MIVRKISEQAGFFACQTEEASEGLHAFMLCRLDAFMLCIDCIHKIDSSVVSGMAAERLAWKNHAASEGLRQSTPR
jgi:hypothetical protein